MKLALLRHGITEWNLEKRIQGRIDQPLCSQGRDRLAQLSLPPPMWRVIAGIAARCGAPGRVPTCSG